MPSQTESLDTTALLSDLRGVFGSGRTRGLTWRLEQLRGIERLCDERETEIAAALAEDLGRGPVEAWLGDIASTKAEATYARKHLKKWMRRRRVSLPLNQLPARGWVQYDPLGVVLVIGPWNYPLYLSLAPLVAAVAAGNCAVVKPSELAPATSAVLARLVPQYLDPQAVRVVEGDAAVTQDLLAQGFDHALFTGGTRGRQEDHGRRGPDLDAGHPRARWQESGHRGGRRRPRRGREAHRVGETAQLRADLHRARLCAGRAVDCRRARRQDRRECARIPFR